MARPREFTWSLNCPPSQREGALSFAHLVTVPIILTNECCCCSRFTGEKTGSAKIKLKSHSLWDLPAAGLYFSVSEMGLTRMPCSEPRSRHPQGLGHASSSSVSSSHRQRKAGGSRGFKFPPSLFSVILPGSSALAAWIVGCGACGVGRRAPGRSQNIACGVQGPRAAPSAPGAGEESLGQAWCDQELSLSRTRVRAVLRRPFSSRLRLLGSALSPKVAPAARGEEKTAGGSRATARGEPREGLRPQSVGGEAVWGRRGTGWAPVAALGPGLNSLGRKVRARPARTSERRMCSAPPLPWPPRLVPGLRDSPT